MTSEQEITELNDIILTETPITNETEKLLTEPRTSEFWKTFPILPCYEWISLFGSIENAHKSKRWLSDILVHTRTDTSDAFYEFPTLETLKCLEVIFHVLIKDETIPILSVGSGIALLERLYNHNQTSNKCSIVCTDDFSNNKFRYFNNNVSSRQMEVEPLSYVDAVSKYKSSKIIFSSWVPFELNITDLILMSNPEIEVFVIIGEPIDDISNSGSTGCPEMYKCEGWKLMSVYPLTLSQIDKIPSSIHHTQIDIFYKKSAYPNLKNDQLLDFPNLNKEWLDPKGKYILTTSEVFDDLLSIDKCSIQ